MLFAIVQAALLVFIQSSAAPQKRVELRLKHGMKVILIPQGDHPVAVVALGVRAGVYDEPEGRCGLAHLTEHLFWQGASTSYPAHRAFEALSRAGPLGQPYQDANAETMWDLTYYYTARPAGGVKLALDVYAEKLRGVTVEAGLLNAERDKVLAEIDFATQNLKKYPALARSLPRYPKAGIASHVRALELAHVEAFLATHYRPERCVVLVQGSMDVNEVRRHIESAFSSIPVRPAQPILEGQLQDCPSQAMAYFDYSRATARERAAVRVLGVLWEQELRRQDRAYVEHSGSGQMRAVLMKADAEAVRSSRAAVTGPITAEQLHAGRALVANPLKRLQRQMAQRPPAGLELKQSLPILMQTAIWTLQFEAQGGQELLDELAKLSSQDITAAAKKFLSEKSQRVRMLP